MCLIPYFLLTIPNIHVHIEVTAVEAALNALAGLTIFSSIKLLETISLDCAIESNSKYLLLWPTVLLSISSIGLKLTGVPIFLLGIYILVRYFYRSKITHYLRFLSIFIFLIIFLIASRIFAASIVSGCPFYPSSFLHLPVPW